VRDEGAVVPPGDADALARAVVACLTDDERLARMSADSAAIGRETSWDRIAERTAQLYREL
jgi:glycosyltransferase involved in cell wall biosynthesis